MDGSFKVNIQSVLIPFWGKVIHYIFNNYFARETKTFVFAKLML